MGRVPRCLVCHAASVLSKRAVSQSCDARASRSKKHDALLAAAVTGPFSKVHVLPWTHPLLPHDGKQDCRNIQWASIATTRMATSKTAASSDARIGCIHWHKNASVVVARIQAMKAQNPGCKLEPRLQGKGLRNEKLHHRAGSATTLRVVRVGSLAVLWIEGLPVGLRLSGLKLAVLQKEKRRWIRFHQAESFPRLLWPPCQRMVQARSLMTAP